MAAGNIPYIGSKISLITTSDIRYEGILYTLNREESTIAVQNVRSFGTEGRRCPEVPMSNEIYDFIIFRGKDLKDLTVIQSAPERPSPSAFGAGADFSDSHGGSLYSQTHTDPYGGGLQAGGGAAQASSLSSAYGRQSAVPRNGFAAAVPAVAGKGPMASSYGGASYPSPASAASSRAVELKSAPAAAYGAVTASRAPYPSVADPHCAAMVGAVPRSAPGLKTFADEAAANAVNVGVGAGGMPVQRGTAQEATAEARSSSESKGRQAAAGAAAEQKAKQEAAAAVAAAAAAGTRGRGKGGGAQKKSLYEVLRFHPRAQEAIMKTMRSQRTSVVQPSELRAMSETNGSVYHFYVDFLNYCCPPSHTVQSDEQQWESLSKALKKNFEKEFGSGQNQKAEQPQRPNNTLGDFISVETSKAGKKGVKVPARGGGRLGRGTGRGDKKDEVSSGKLDASGSLEDVGTQSSSWVCPRCTLRNENTLLECAACGTSKQQAALWAEFPPLG